MALVGFAGKEVVADPTEGPTIMQCPNNGFVNMPKLLKIEELAIDPMEVKDIKRNLMERAVRRFGAEIGKIILAMGCINVTPLEKLVCFLQFPVAPRIGLVNP